MNRSELQKEIIKKVMADESFRGEFFSDPKGMAEKVYGSKLPDGIGVNVLIEDANTISIILPKNIGELSGDNSCNVDKFCPLNCHYCPTDCDYCPVDW